MLTILLPLRYFFRRPITYLAAVAVALCVFIVVVVMSVMNGLVSDFKVKNHNFVGDCIVSSDSLVGFAYYESFIDELEKQEFVAAVSGIINGFGLLGQPEASVSIAIEVTGIDPVKHSKATGFGEMLYYHKLDIENAFVPLHTPAQPGCIVGINKIQIPCDQDGVYHHPEIPQQYIFEVSSFPLNPSGGLAKAGSEVVNKKKFHYSDDCHSGLVKVDGDMMFLPFEAAQSLFEMGGSTPRINAIHIKFSEGTSLSYGTEQVSLLWKEHVKKYSKATYANLLDNVAVEDWKTNRREIIAPMEKEQTMLMFLFAMLGVITVFIIFVVFYMIISSRSKDIGILKSVGVSSTGVVCIFGTLAIIIASVGSVIGVLGGCGFLVKINDMEDWLFEHYQWQLWNRNVYAIGDIPNEIELPVLAAIVASAIAAALIAVTVPSLQAARRKPVETLQVNQL